MAKKKHDALLRDFLGEDSINEKYLLRKLRQLEESGEHDIYANVLQLLTHLTFTPSEAKGVWQKVVAHKDMLSTKIGRDVGLRVALLDYFINLNRKIKNPKIIELKLFEETAKKAMIDELTGTYNRRYFDEALAREFKQARRHKRDFSLMITDIDDFKRINDEHGHYTGDKVLKRLGLMLKKLTRSEDTVCRIGGEEFAILMPDTSGEGAAAVGEKIRKSFAKVKVVRHSLSLSGGIASFPADSSSKDELMVLADKSLYFAKYAGKNRIVLHAQNKRRDFRFPVNWHIKYGPHLKTSVSKDVSLDGVSFEVEEPLGVGEIVQLNLDSEGDTEGLTMRAEVVWVDGKGESKPYRIGTRFVRPSTKDIKKLKARL